MSEAVVGSFVAREGQDAEALQPFEALVEPTHGGDGCILDVLHRGNDDPRRLAFVQRWESKPQLEAHLESDHVKGVLGRFDELFETGDIVIYDAVPGGQDKKGSLAAHAGG